MAPSTPSKSVGSRLVKNNNLFSRPALHIAVGSPKKSFYVHIPQLAKTAFFDVHGRPAGAQEKDLQSQTKSPTPRDATVTPPPMIKEEAELEETGLEGTEGNYIFVPQTGRGPDYDLSNPILQPAAFEIIVEWLYNKTPEVPRTRVETRTLLRAYILSTMYKMEPLQDILVDRLRKYHQEYHVSFDDLKWLIRRLGDNRETHLVPMVRYLVDQIAWEVYIQGFGQFVLNNPTFVDFLSLGDHPIRVLLFESLSILGNGNHTDPATGLNRWRVRDRVDSQVPICSNEPPEILSIDD
jgi:hypothetical protein